MAILVKRLKEQFVLLRRPVPRLAGDFEFGGALLLGLLLEDEGGGGLAKGLRGGVRAAHGGDVAAVRENLLVLLLARGEARLLLREGGRRELIGGHGREAGLQVGGLVARGGEVGLQLRAREQLLVEAVHKGVVLLRRDCGGR